MNNLFKKGDRVVVVKRDGGLVEGTYSHLKPNGYCYVRGDDNIPYERRPEKIKKIGEASTNFEIHGNTAIEQVKKEKNPETVFDINKRFDFLKSMVSMVIKGTSTSLVITGEGGLGKSYTVKERLDVKRLAQGLDYEIIKGYSTPKSLFRSLYENNGKLIVFDDCDSILEDKVALNILKSALDSYDKRTIYWLSERVNDGLPAYFDFEGRIIFISNKSQQSIDQAILSRSMSVDVTMSSDDKIERMRRILPSLKTSVPLELKEKCLDLINKYKDYAMDLNMRTLIKTIEIASDPENEDIWEEVAIYSITNTHS